LARARRRLPVFAAVSFWSASLAAWALRPFHRAAVGVPTDSALAARRPWSRLLLALSRLPLAPLALHCSICLPDPPPLSLRRPQQLAAYTGAGLMVVSAGPALPGAGGPDPALLKLAQGAFAVCAGAAALALLLRRPRGPAPELRRRRLLITVTAAGLLPLLALSVGPELVWGAPLVDSVWTLPALALLPFGYAYAIGQGEPGRAGPRIGRSLACGLLTAAALGLYLLLFYALDALVPALRGWPLTLSAALALVGAALLGPLRARLRRWADRLIYGGWYDYRMVVLSSSAALSQARTLDQLAERLMAIARTMRFTSAALLWNEGELLAPRGSFGYPPELLRLLRLPSGGAVARSLARIGQAMTCGQAGQLLRTPDLSDAERALLATQQFRLWLPLPGEEAVRGALVLGGRLGGAPLDKEDRDILATVVWQATVTAAHVVLLEALHARLAEMERIQDDLSEAQKRLADGREEERLYLAQELHDGPMQELYGILFELGSLAKSYGDEPLRPQLAALQETTQQVIRDLRSICVELRPPALAPFGLEVAIRSHVQTFRENNPDLDVQIDLMHDGVELSERVRLALFRIYQEAINNIAQHAEASSIFICLLLDEQQIVLEIRDDGHGFAVPQHLITLARAGHLGLLGIAERAAAIGGRAQVISAPGEGTTIRVTAPRSGALAPKHYAGQLLK
jgi:signal transduction histidine kinase